jgi:hypothetical protein
METNRFCCESMIEDHHPSCCCCRMNNRRGAAAYRVVWMCDRQRCRCFSYYYCATGHPIGNHSCAD